MNIREKITQKAEGQVKDFEKIKEELQKALNEDQIRYFMKWQGTQLVDAAEASAFAKSILEWLKGDDSEDIHKNMFEVFNKDLAFSSRSESEQGSAGSRQQDRSHRKAVAGWIEFLTQEMSVAKG